MKEHMDSTDVIDNDNIVRYIVLHINWYRCSNLDGYSFKGPEQQHIDVPICHRLNHIAIIRWTNVGILLAVFWARRWQLTLARCHFAHRADLIANGWFDVGPTPLVQQSSAYANAMATILFQVSRWANVGYYLFVGEIWFSLLLVIAYNNLIYRPL